MESIKQGSEKVEDEQQDQDPFSDQPLDPFAAETEAQAKQESEQDPFSAEAEEQQQEEPDPFALEAAEELDPFATEAVAAKDKNEEDKPEELSQPAVKSKGKEPMVSSRPEKKDKQSSRAKSRSRRRVQDSPSDSESDSLHSSKKQLAELVRMLSTTMGMGPMLPPVFLTPALIAAITAANTQGGIAHLIQPSVNQAPALHPILAQSQNSFSSQDQRPDVSAVLNPSNSVSNVQQGPSNVTKQQYGTDLDITSPSDLSEASESWLQEDAEVLCS